MREICNFNFFHSPQELNFRKKALGGCYMFNAFFYKEGKQRIFMVWFRSWACVCLLRFEETLPTQACSYLCFAHCSAKSKTSVTIHFSLISKAKKIVMTGCQYFLCHQRNKDHVRLSEFMIENSRTTLTLRPQALVPFLLQKPAV